MLFVLDQHRMHRAGVYVLFPTNLQRCALSMRVNGSMKEPCSATWGAVEPMKSSLNRRTTSGGWHNSRLSKLRLCFASYSFASMI